MVETGDKNNCRPSSSKSTSNTSEQNLNSSFQETQDNKTEDDSSTNGSAGEQDSSSWVDQCKKMVVLIYPGQKKTRIQEEGGSDTEGMKIKLEEFLTSF